MKNRSYRSPRRAAQAARTHEAVLAASRELFLLKGWTGTTIAAIAGAAGVSNETVYAGFGNKRAILRELVLRAVRGEEPDLPLIHQQAPRRIAREGDQMRQIEFFAADIASVLERVAPLMDVARTAATTDDAMAELHAGFHRGRRENLEWFAEALMRNGPLKDGMDAGTATATLWRLASPDLYLLMRRVEGCSREAYADWLAASLKRLLLE